MNEKVAYTNSNNVCGGQNAWFLTKNGLYEALMQSRKPIAKQFKKGVKEILRNVDDDEKLTSAILRAGQNH